MVTAVFDNGSDSCTVAGLWQYDYGQKLMIQGLNLPAAVEIDFSLKESGGESEPRVGITKDGVTVVPIPDSMLENGDTAQNYSIYAFVYITTEESGKTIKKITMLVKSRPKPQAFNTPEEVDLFREAIAVVNESTIRAENAEKSAEAWAHGHEEYPERDEDNAAYYAGLAKENASKTSEDLYETQRLVESMAGSEGRVSEDLRKVEEYTSQAAVSASNAALSEQSADSSRIAAENAQAGAEAAEDQATLAAEDAAASKSAAELAKTEAQKSAGQASADKEEVTSMKNAFSATYEQAVKDVNSAGSTQIKNVNDAGTVQVKAVEDTGAAQATELQKYKGVMVSDTEPTEEAVEVWIEPEAEEEYQMPEIKDDEENEVDTWSSKKIAGEIGGLKGDLTNVENCESSKIIAVASGSDISGFPYYYDGTWQESSYFRTTDYINVSGYDYIEITDSTTSSTSTQGFNAHVCFYDSSKKYVSGVHREVKDPVEVITDRVSIPNNAKYARISYIVSASDNFKIEVPIPICEKVNSNTEKISVIEPILNSMEYREHSKNWFDRTKATVTSESGVKGYLSDYIPVVQGDVLYASKNATRYNGGMGDESFYLVRYYNESKQNISNSDYWQLSVTVPSGVSYARCYVGQVDYARIMIEKNTRTNLWEEFYEDGYVLKSEVDKDDALLYGSVSMFDRIGAIGDSFTEGYAKASDGTYNTNKNHSYIGVMAKRAGINYANYGHSGATTRSYLTDKLPSVLSDSACDFYFLALGINDVGLGTSYIGSIDDIHDDYTQNADTFYGNYGKIISQVKAHSPKALFCLIKIPLFGTNVKEFSSAIDEIGEHFGIPVINPYDDEFFKSSVYEKMNDGHPTLLGYTGMALAYERLLSKAIKDNPEYFKFATIG